MIVTGLGPQTRAQANHLIEVLKKSRGEGDAKACRTVPRSGRL